MSVIEYLWICDVSLFRVIQIGIGIYFSKLHYNNKTSTPAARASAFKCVASCWFHVMRTGFPSIIFAKFDLNGGKIQPQTNIETCLLFAVLSSSSFLLPPRQFSPKPRVRGQLQRRQCVNDTHRVSTSQQQGLETQCLELGMSFLFFLSLLIISLQMNYDWSTCLATTTGHNNGNMTACNESATTARDDYDWSTTTMCDTLSCQWQRRQHDNDTQRVSDRGR